MTNEAKGSLEISETLAFRVMKMEELKMRKFAFISTRVFFCRAISLIPGENIFYSSVLEPDCFVKIIILFPKRLFVCRSI